MKNVYVRGVEVMFVVNGLLSKSETDRLNQEFNKFSKLEVVRIEQIEDKKTLIKILVPTSHDLIVHTVTSLINRLDTTINL